MAYAQDIVPTSFSTSRFWTFVQEQPLVAAALGLAFGAFLAALLPRTRTENAMLGGASDELKERARAAAKEEAENLKAVASRTADAAREGAGQVAERAAAAAEQEGYPAGTLRAEHQQATTRR